jgi:hypothetical protein
METKRLIRAGSLPPIQEPIVSDYRQTPHKIATYVKPPRMQNSKYSEA